ncbi:hypothetical protein [Actinoalloteichus sp. GBA129-24]|uniref:hypothetical protein n=1 Tax=Actinoalloteichus sp. GBA129-24 TaxID=1612551 RepID=UPI0009505F9B|nr:hypothetical protein [Actinoalloteichus sp. GBA129-24]APU22604.1 hypothetical protein UA75_23110 [Actinoalloteichus sp. GBA129-24]
MRLVEDQFFFMLTAAGTSLMIFGGLDLAWRWWRARHPPRRPPSTKDWRRIRAAERRSQARRPWAAQADSRSSARLVIARVHAETAAAAVAVSPRLVSSDAFPALPLPCAPTRFAEAAPRRPATPTRSGTAGSRHTADRVAVPAPADGWVRVLSGSLR